MKKVKTSKTKPLPAAGSRPGLSAQIGGVANDAVKPSQKNQLAFERGGSVPSSTQGGFRNKAMEHKR